MIMGTSGESHGPQATTVSSESGSTPIYNHADHGGRLSSSMISSTLVKKEEYKEGNTSSDLTDNHNDISDVWPDFKDHHRHDFGFTETTTALSNEDVVSNMQYLDMDLVKSIDFESDFPFDEVAFPLDPL